MMCDPREIRTLDKAKYKPLIQQSVAVDKVMSFKKLVNIVCESKFETTLSKKINFGCNK